MKKIFIKFVIFIGVFVLCGFFYPVKNIISNRVAALAAEIEKTDVKPAININLPDGQSEGDDYWVWIKPMDKFSSNKEKNKGVSKKGDIISIETVTPQHEPTSSEKSALVVIKVSGLTKEDIQKYTQIWQEGPENPDSKTLAYRQYKLDIDALGLKIGLDANPKSASAFRGFTYLKDNNDLAQYEKGRKLYALKTAPKKFATAIKNYVVPPTRADTYDYSCINCTGAACTEATCASTEDWNDLALWEADTDVDLTASVTQTVALAYSGDGLSTVAVDVNGATVDATHYRVITVASGNRHNGKVDMNDPPVGFTLDMGATAVRPIRLTDAYSIVEWVRIRDWTVGNRNGIDALNAAGLIIRNNIVHNSSGCSGEGAGIYKDANNSGAVYNNIVANLSGSGTCNIRGIYSLRGLVYNNTVYNITTSGTGGALGFDGGTTTTPPTFINNIATNCTTEPFDGGTYNASTDYNACDVASCTSVGGTHNLNSLDSDDLYTSLAANAQDLHLASTTANSILIDSGVSAAAALSCTAGSTCYDIDNDVIPYPVAGDWDIGADEEDTASPASLSITSPGEVGMPDYQLGGVGYTEQNFDSLGSGGLIQVTASTGFTVTVSSTTFTGTKNTIAASLVKLETNGTVGTNPTVIDTCTGFSGITETTSGEYALDSAQTIVTTTSGTGTCNIYPTIRLYIADNLYSEQDSGTLTFTVA